MEPKLDIRTLSIFVTYVGAVCSLGLFAFGVTQSKFKGFGALSIGAALIAVGCYLIGWRNIWPDYITIIVANISIITGILFFYEGTRRFFTHSSRPHVISVLLFLVSVVLFLYFTYWSKSVNNRIISISIVVFIICTLCVNEIKRNHQGIWRLSELITLLIFALYGIFSIFRLFFTLNQAPIHSFMSARNIQPYAFVGVVSLIIGVMLGFVWMVADILIGQLTELANRDPLTQVLNRRGVDFLLTEVFGGKKRRAFSMTTILLDIDYFKQINDRFSHQAGDQVLEEFSKLIKCNIRTADVLGRIGGEEFIILLPDINLEQGTKTAEKLRAIVENYEFVVDEAVIRVSASFGVSDYLPDDVNIDKLLKFSDKALYQSKEKGRNCVTSIAYTKG